MTRPSSEARVSQWFFTSDLHGHGPLYEQLLAIAAADRPEAVIIGGDLCPHRTGNEGLGFQRVFLQGFLVEFARRLRDATPGTELVLIMGNDDWRSNDDCLDAHHGSLWHSIHGRAATIGGIAVAGLSWVPITPFGIKDWERWEDGDEERPARLEGFVSRGEWLEPHAFDPAQRSPTIAEALEELAGATRAGETLFVLHSPPRNTHCDVTGGRQHVGSRAVRRFIERHQPPLVLSGHIHESPRMTSFYRDTIGRTVVVNPGQFGTSRLCGVRFDPANPGETLRHTVHG
jgi:Icc-related predicted phosphoesterase